MKAIKWTTIIAGVPLAFTLALVVALIAYVPGRDADRLVRASKSPDGSVVAEIHQVITPMWGGADRLEVRLSHANHFPSDVVYSSTFECAGLNDFRLTWTGPHTLEITLGRCTSGPFNGSSSDPVISRKLDLWKEVGITYIKSTTGEPEPTGANRQP